MKEWIDGAMLLLMTGSLAGTFLNRWQLGRGITWRIIQFVGLTWVLGITVVLALEGRLEGVAGTLLGGVTGYLLGKSPDEKADSG